MPRSDVRTETLVLPDGLRADVWRADDDWTAIDSKEEKKRRQNRINQRAYRRRNPANEKPSKHRPFRVERFRITDLPAPPAAFQTERRIETIDPVSSQLTVRNTDPVEQHSCSTQETSSACVEHMQNMEIQARQTLLIHPEVLVASSSPGGVSSDGNCNSSGLDLFLKATEQARSDIGVIDHLGSMASAVSSTSSTLSTWIQDPRRSTTPQIPPCTQDVGHFHSRDPNGQALFRISFEELISPAAAENSLLAGKPLPKNRNGFPLSSDHLLRLIHFNVFRGLITNKALLSDGTFQVKVELDFVLPESKSLCDGLTIVRSKPGQALPRSLYPTYFQASVAHSSWINMFPFPAIRDNLIRAEKDFDHEDLCYDLFGEMFFNSALRPLSNEVRAADDELEDDVTARRKGLIVWGEPWDMNSWEITPGFARKWAWVLENCHQLIESTNHWRANRDEKPLNYCFDEMTM